MANSLFGGWVRACLIAGVLLTAGGVGRAAGEWEWTDGQGWVQGAGVSRPTAKEQLAYSYELEQKGEFMDAARQYFLLIQNFPDSEEAGVGLQRLAKCLFEMENYYTSYKAIEQVIKTYPNTGRMSDLIEIELRIAKKMLLSQASGSVFEDDNSRAREGNTRRALEIVNSVLDHDPYGPVAAEALLVKGEAHLYINEIADARTSFDRILDEFPKSDFIERARLGQLRCDSLLGQARPQEVYDQIEVVREMEADRKRDPDAWDEFDDVEESINQLAEVEAAKMMEQAAQYRRMGTHSAVKSAEFLYKEVNRRYPTTPQAEEAREKLGGIKVPREQSRVAQAVRSININPFTWNRDPEPPWIVPQLSPEDTVMIDSGIGPIAGVPETDFPVGDGARVRPAALDRATLSADAGPGTGVGAAFSPIDGGPPENVQSGQFSPLATAPAPGGSPYSPMSPYGSGDFPASAFDLEPARTAPPALATPNPLPAISDSDLIGGVGSSSSVYQPAPAPATTYQGYDQFGSSYPGGIAAGPAQPTLGPIPDAALADLVPPTRRLDAPAAVYQPAPAYQDYAAPPIQDPFAQPPVDYGYSAQPPLPEPSYYPEPTYQSDSGLYSGQPTRQPVPYGNEMPSQGGGWMLGDDFQ